MTNSTPQTPTAQDPTSPSLLSNQSCDGMGKQPSVYEIPVAAGLGESSLANVMSFLTFGDVLRCRLVCSGFAKGADWDCSRPSPNMVRMAYTRGSPSAVARYAAQSNTALRWMCQGCKTSNNIATLQCRRCGMNNPQGQQMRRIFLGQLPKERTAEICEWMLARLFPEVRVFHIEAHTSKDGKSKGCAWVYVPRSYDETRILTLSRRIFIDVDQLGREGLIMCHPEAQAELKALSSSRASVKTRQAYLPRQPLVCELPSQRESSTRAPGIAPAPVTQPPPGLGKSPMVGMCHPHLGNSPMPGMPPIPMAKSPMVGLGKSPMVGLGKSPMRIPISPNQHPPTVTVGAQPIGLGLQHPVQPQLSGCSLASSFSNYSMASSVQSHHSMAASVESRASVRSRASSKGSYTHDPYGFNALKPEDDEVAT